MVVGRPPRTWLCIVRRPALSQLGCCQGVTTAKVVSATDTQ